MEYLCNQCHNLMKIQLVVDTKKLILDCPSCNFKKDWNSDTCIYKTSVNIDVSQILNTNPNLTKDNTLPKIINNPNIKCINTDCESHKLKKSEIKFIKYNHDDMKYMYICNFCGQSWKNTND